MFLCLFGENLVAMAGAVVERLEPAIIRGSCRLYRFRSFPYMKGIIKLDNLVFL